MTAFEGGTRIVRRRRDVVERAMSLRLRDRGVLWGAMPPFRRDRVALMGPRNGVEEAWNLVWEPTIAFRQGVRDVVAQDHGTEAETSLLTRRARRAATVARHG